MLDTSCGLEEPGAPTRCQHRKATPRAMGPRGHPAPPAPSSGPTLAWFHCSSPSWKFGWRWFVYGKDPAGSDNDSQRRLGQLLWFAGFGVECCNARDYVFAALVPWHVSASSCDVLRPETGFWAFFCCIDFKCKTLFSYWLLTVISYTFREVLGRAR